MPDFEIVKRGPDPKTGKDGGFVGFTPEDTRRYVAFQDRCRDMGPGEFVKVKVTYPRDLVHHRRMMALFRFAFEQWQPEMARKRHKYKGLEIYKDFDAMRKDLTILAGYYEAKYDLKGRVSLEAKSIAFDKMGDDEARSLYAALFEVVYQNILVPKGYTREVANEVLAEYERFTPT